jgi:hypothetical protein
MRRPCLGRPLTDGLRVELAVAQAFRQHRKRTGKNSDIRRSIAPVLNNTGAKADQAAVRLS